MNVVCPDGQIRQMKPDLKGFIPDIDRPVLLMMQGTIILDGQQMHGSAFLKKDDYYFTPD